MRCGFCSLAIALLLSAAPAWAETTSGTARSVKPREQAPMQVTIVKRDARENMIAVRQVELARAIELASQLVPGAVSSNDADIKSITITYN